MDEEKVAYANVSFLLFMQQVVLLIYTVQLAFSIMFKMSMYSSL